MNKLHLSFDAQRDLADVKAYITAELGNPQAALAVTARITKKIRLLREHGSIGTPLYSVENKNTGYRFLTSGNYIIFYRAVEEDIFVDRILYGRRDYFHILFGDMEEETTEE